MRLVVIFLIVVLAGCASRGRPANTMPYEQMKTIKYTYKDCENIDLHINTLESQLRARRLLKVDPETLDEQDRMYNATARILIWNLRIDCNNRTRFK